MGVKKVDGHSTEITVQPEDIDVLNHMNNIIYIQYLENAVTVKFNRTVFARLK